ncbi:unnamed protein product [Peronospora farinosa]|uniref:Uncharacterized protein n=1 Tax=Peronospora farinosa TaxID=134698 RepID=A0AAV0STU7_9STRA|nr:unnamed protein product [Peronospora farinosa]CAI5705142.1 unnamed protein product [Peronospora farinosa]
MSKSTDHHAVVEEEFLMLEHVLNQTAGDTSACLKLLKKHLSEYDSRNSNHLSNTATSYMKKDMRTAKDAASSLKHVADEMSKNRTKTEVASARNMMNATAKAMETLKITARNYDKENKQSKGIKGTIDAAMGGHHNKDKDEKHDKKKDEKHDKKKDEKHDMKKEGKHDKKKDEKHDKKKNEKHDKKKDEKHDEKEDEKHDKKEDEKHETKKDEKKKDEKHEKHDKQMVDKYDKKEDEKHEKKKDEKHEKHDKQMVDKYDKKEDEKHHKKEDEKHEKKKDEKHEKKKDEKHEKKKDEKHEKKKDEKHEKKKDEKHGLFGKDYTHKDGGLLDTNDKNGGGILGSTDTVEVLVEKTLHDNFSLTALDHQITATEKALSPSMMERAKEKIHDVKEKLTGDSKHM